MTPRTPYRSWHQRVLYFFPVQLLLLHVKKNHLLLLVWLLLFGYVTGNIGVKYGVPHLFLFPEYFGRVDMLSYLITGFSLGGFIVAFNLYSYTLHAYRFPFISTIGRPFLKFNVNNSTIPVLFILTYLWCSGHFQVYKEFVPPGRMVLHLAAFLLGVTLFLGLALLYFTRTNTDIIKVLGREPEETTHEPPLVDIIAPLHDRPPIEPAEKRKATRWLRRAQRVEKWRVESYLTPRLRLLRARSSAHYDRDLLRGILWQNHINGSIFEMGLVLSFILLGAFSEVPLFAIPAGASAFLLFTMLLMVFSALYSWMQDWTVPVLFLAVLLINGLSHHTDAFLADSKAYGLDYAQPPATYDQPTLAAMANDTAAAQRDALALVPTLERWADNNRALPHPGEKPPLVIINTSGGGMRAMLWSFLCLQHADSVLGGTLMPRTLLMTGSSGGLIGATYYRQLHLRDQRSGAAGTDAPARNDRSLIQHLSEDILNTVAFSFVTNDMFVRYRRVKDGGRRYTMDRGHAFEEALGRNTRGALQGRLGDMAEAERQARTPMLVISPTSINDGRRLVIAAQPMAFLTTVTPEPGTSSIGQAESIEFRRLFHEHGADSLKLTTALRMNASFPYISPLVTLPSEPPMRVMDAGARDNYGYRTTLSFLQTFRHWIAEHTGGVVVLQLRDMQKELAVQSTAHSLLGRLVAPMGSVYDNFVRTQDQDYDLMLRLASAWMPFPLEVVDLQLRHGADDDRISLSWHLTALERARVLRSMDNPDNRRAMARFRQLVAGEVPAMLASGGSAPARAMDRAPH